MRKLFTAALVFLAPLHATIPNDTYIIATRLDDLKSLDPGEMFEATAVEYAHNTYDRLVFYDPEKEGAFLGLIAENWTISPDGKTYTFQIKKDLQFTSKNPITAEDAAFSLQRIILLNKTPAYLFTQFGWTKENVSDMVRAKDAHTLELSTDAQYAPSLLLYCLTSANAAVIDKKTVLLHEVENDLGNKWLKTHYAGSGPFTLHEWTPSLLFLTRNESYFRGKPYLRQIVLMHVPEESTQKMMLMKKDIDAARSLGLDQAENVEGVVVHQYPLSMTYFMSMNQKNKFLSIPEVRQAIKYLIDYDGLEKVTRGMMKVHQSFIPKGFFAACHDTPFNYNPEKAKELLKQAGLEKGFTVTLDTSNSEVAQALQAMFQQANIQINILLGDSKQVLTKIRTREHDLSLSTWVPDYCDPHNNAATFAYNPDNSDATTQKTIAWRNSWDTTKLNDRVFEAMREQDTLKRRGLYIDLQRYFHENAPFVNIFQEIRILAEQKTSQEKGVHFMNPLGLLNYFSVKEDSS